MFGNWPMTGHYFDHCVWLCNESCIVKSALPVPIPPLALHCAAHTCVELTQYREIRTKMKSHRHECSYTRITHLSSPPSIAPPVAVGVTRFASPINRSESSHQLQQAAEKSGQTNEDRWMWIYETNEIDRHDIIDRYVDDSCTDR